MTTRTPGRIVWHDHMTHDLDASLAFYSRVFHWGTSEMDLGAAGRYRMWTVGEAGFGGVVPLGEERDMPSCWLPYAAVADLDAGVQRAIAAGATIGQPATELPGLGRYAVVLAGSGAAIALWEGIDDDVPDEVLPGTVCWSELATRDVDDARALYGELFGWESRRQDMGDLGEYYLFRAGDRDVAGLRELSADDPGPGRWVPYVLVPDADATAREVAGANGRVVVPPTDIPGLGRFLEAMDPAGARFGAITFAGGD